MGHGSGTRRGGRAHPLRHQLGEESTVDDYESGSRAAAAGGITTYVNFAFQEPGGGLMAAIEREAKKAAERSVIDYGFHAVIIDPSATALGELPALAAAGFTSAKIFTANTGMALSDRDVLRVMQAARAAGMMVNVHAEDAALVHHLTQELLREGCRGVEYLPRARPSAAEAMATARVAAYSSLTARNCWRLRAGGGSLGAGVTAA